MPALERVAFTLFPVLIISLLMCPLSVLSLDICDMLSASLSIEPGVQEQVSTEFWTHIYFSHLPKAGPKAGKFSKLSGVGDWQSCFHRCCQDVDCDVVLFTVGTCYHIACVLDPPDSCLPQLSSNPKHNTTVMIVRNDASFSFTDSDPQLRALSSEPWPSSSSQHLPTTTPMTTTTSPTLSSPPTTPTTASSSQPPSWQSSWSQPRLAGQSCGSSLQNRCVANAACVRLGSSVSPEAVCVCSEGYHQNLRGTCDLNSGSPTASILSQPTASESTQGRTAPPISTVPSVTKLTVSAGANKTIQLPENSVTLSAFVLPKPEGETYTYEWTAVQLPDNAETASMDGKNTDTLKLFNLLVGVYVLKIKVTGLNKFGEAVINVTVLPAPRQNQPPQAIIHQPVQEVYLPNVAILDGSDSKDDAGIAKFKWEEVSGPLQEHELNYEGPMLSLKDLAPGNYTFRLTVTDTDGATNSTSANVTIHKEKDYPPKADAGSDVVIHLPVTSVTLYGNSSSDDKVQLNYEWIKVSDDKLTVGMAGVRTPFLQLSNLEVGDYKFVLKVTDSAGQSDTAEVQVFVKPETNHPPSVRTAGHLSLYLPQDSLTLDGSNSTDDISSLEYQWTQTGGPSTLTITNADKALAVAIGKIVEGDYEFQLTVVDGEKQQASDKLTITVKKDVNLAPKANAGGNKVVTLPVSLVTLDGSKSWDDRAITSFLWKRDSKSLAAGMIVNNSDHQAVLQLVHLVAGQYMFTLTVQDADGLSSSDTARITVNKSPTENDVVEMILDADIEHFTMADKESLVDQLELLLQRSSEDRETSVDIIAIIEDVSTGHLCITFQVLQHGPSTYAVMDGEEALQTLRSKISSGKILEYSIVRLELEVCQNNCSGHGHCDQKTKICICEAFWMPNLFTSNWLGSGSNCDWSILYVVIVSCLILVAIISTIWILVCCCTSKRCRSKLKGYRHQKYTLLKDAEGMDARDKMAMTVKGKSQNSSVMLSESELSSDEETLFISHKKASNGINSKGSTGNGINYRNGLKT